MPVTEACVLINLSQSQLTQGQVGESTWIVSLAGRKTFVVGGSRL